VFSPAEDACRIAYGGSDTIPREEKIEQRVQADVPGTLADRAPTRSECLARRGRYRKFLGALVSPVKAMDKRSCHLRIEFKIEVAHGGSPSSHSSEVASTASKPRSSFWQWTALMAVPVNSSVGQGRQFCRTADCLDVDLMEC
jgi:hypothetical protein